jgi:hypothetical protein
VPPLALVLAALSPLAVSLPSGTVDGHPVLGRTVPQVEEALGLPAAVERYPDRRDLVFRRAGRLQLEVIFHGPFAAPARERAWAILVADPDATVAGLGGRPLVLPPATLERRLRALPLHEERRYRCDRRGCFGTFFSRDGRRRVVYGRQRTGRYLGVQVWPSP